MYGNDGQSIITIHYALLVSLDPFVLCHDIVVTIFLSLLLAGLSVFVRMHI